MTRISLVPLAAALLLAIPATSFAQNLPANDPRWSRAINLMPLIDLERDVIKGNWKMEGGTLVSRMDMGERIQIPYEPPDEYEYRIVFSIRDGANFVMQIFSHAGHMAGWTMGGNKNTLFGFERIGGKSLRDNPTTVKSNNCLEKGRVYASILSVRRNGIKTYLDGKLLAEWKRGYDDAELTRGWDLPNHRLLGFGTYQTRTVFERIELLEITGKGRVVPGTEIARTTPPSEKIKTPKEAPEKVVATEEAGRATTVLRPADPELQKSARPFLRPQSSIKGLFVIRMASGQRSGGAQDIIATAEYGRTGYETVCKFATAVANDTQISFDEAIHLVKVRYPIWKAGQEIRFSYSNKYTKQAGGSAGAAFSLLLLSLLEDFAIDPDFAITGDVTVDGKIREVGAVAEKIRGATLDKCRIIALPATNKENLSDLTVLYSPAMLWNAQLFSVSTIDEATAVAHKDRSENLAKAISIFSQVQTALGPNGAVAALRGPSITQKLQEVLQLAPNHLSAEFMLRATRGQLPTALSLTTSLDEIWAAAGPLLGFLFADYKEPSKAKRYYMDKVPTGTFKAAMERLNWLHFRLHPKTMNLKMVMADYMADLDQLHKASTFSAAALKQHLAKRDKVLSEAHTLGTDRKTLEEMMH